MSATNEERLNELDEEIQALHQACEQYEIAIELVGEMFTALAMALPRHSGFAAAVDRLTHTLENRAARSTRPLAPIPLRLLEQFRDDLKMFAGIDETPPPAPTSPRAKFRIIRGDKSD